MERKVPTIGHPADSRIGGLPAAFYAAKKDTLCPTALLAPSSSVCCASNCENPLEALLEDKSWSYPQQMTVKAPLRGI